MKRLQKISIVLQKCTEQFKNEVTTHFTKQIWDWGGNPFSRKSDGTLFCWGICWKNYQTTRTEHGILNICKKYEKRRTANSYVKLSSGCKEEQERWGELTRMPRLLMEMGWDLKFNGRELCLVIDVQVNVVISAILKNSSLYWLSSSHCFLLLFLVPRHSEFHCWRNVHLALELM